MKLALIFFLSTLIGLQISLAEESSRKSESGQELFLSSIYLKRVTLNDRTFHFEACDRASRTCKTITRGITQQELKNEQALLEKEMHFRFRRGLPVGAVFFSEIYVCTEAGIVIAAVPGLAGGAVVCLNSESDKIQVTELPLSIQALDRLALELGHKTEVVAKGDDGEIYVANLNLMIRYLKNRFPPETAPVNTPAPPQ